MTPEELAALFKRRGDFDSTRKNLLSDFQNSSVGKQFTTQLGDILQGCIDEDPSLLQREKSEFHQAMVERITKSSEYKKVQQFVDSLLQPTQYMSKIENTLMTIVKEHAPPPPEKDTAQDDDKAKGHRSTKGHASTSSKQNKDSHLENGAKGNSSSPALASSSGSTTKSATSATKAPSAKKEDRSESHRSHGGSERRAKDNVSSTPKVKKELNLELPPRPQPRNKERHQGHTTDVAPLVKKEPSSSDLQPSTESSADRPRKHSNHPRKRNRRQQSVDSNSSLSSPPSSSEADSDGDGKEKEGSRAKKLAKKAARDDRADNTLKAGTRPETDASKQANDQHAPDGAELMEGIETATGVIPGGEGQDTKISDGPLVQSDTAKPENAIKDDAMDVDPAVTETGDSKKEASSSNAIEIGHANAVQEEDTSMQGKEPNKDFAPDAASSVKTPTTSTHAPASTIARSSTTSSSSSSNPSSANNSPALTGPGAHRRRESDAVDRRASPGHHGSSHSKRTGHLPLPLPPRPSLSLPPKPTAPLSSNRKGSNARNSSSIPPSTGSATTKSTSSASSASASVPPLTCSSSGSRQPSISGNSGSTGGSGGSTRDKAHSDRSDTRSSGQGHLHHPLPPPPHLQHPLPPTPRSGHSGSRSLSISGAAKAATTSIPASSSKPLISTSQSLIGTGPSSDNSAPTTSTPKSATSLTSPGSAGSAGARNSPRTEEREAGGNGRGSSETSTTAAVSKGDHKLKSPESNSSSGSISSTGSLSTTGSTTNLTALSSPDSGTKEATSIAEPPKDHAVSVLTSAQSPKPAEASATTTVHESVTRTGEALLDNEPTLASQSDAIEHSPTLPPPPPPPTSSPPPSAPSPPPPPPPPPPEPPVASPTPPPPPTTPTPTPAPAGPSSSKQEKSAPGASPPSSSSKPKSHGRTPIPLPSKPHKPIPLPRRPSAPASGSGLGTLKKKYKG